MAAVWSGAVKMTTDLFFKAKTVFRGGPRPVPVPAPVAAPIVATQQYLGQAPISPGPPRPFLEDVPLGSKANAIQTQGFDAMSTSEERAGGGNPRSAPASLVGGL